MTVDDFGRFVQYTQFGTTTDNDCLVFLLFGHRKIVDIFVEFVIYRTKYGRFFQIAGKIQQAHIQIHGLQIQVHRSFGPQQAFTNGFLNRQIVDVNMQRPSLRRVKFQPLLTTCSRATANDLFLVGGHYRGLKNMNVFDIEQINALLETTVQNNKTHQITLHIFGTLIKFAQHGFFHYDRNGLIVYRN